MSRSFTSYTLYALMKFSMNLLFFPGIWLKVGIFILFVLKIPIEFPLISIMTKFSLGFFFAFTFKKWFIIITILCCFIQKKRLYDLTFTTISMKSMWRLTKKCCIILEVVSVHIHSPFELLLKWTLNDDSHTKYAVLIFWHKHVTNGRRHIHDTWN